MTLIANPYGVTVNFNSTLLPVFIVWLVFKSTTIDPITTIVPAPGEEIVTGELSAVAVAVKVQPSVDNL